MMVLNPGFLKEGLMYTVRVKPGRTDETVDYIHQQFRSFFPGSLVRAVKFAEEVDYGTKTLWEIAERIFFAIAVISVLIAANGLFGLVSFAAQRRIKEIGIRKVLGAGIPGLYYMMTKELVVIMLIAIIISLPATYLFVSSTPGAYKYQLQAGDYLSALAMMCMTALAATMYHTTRAVVSNPVESLRSE